MSFGTPQSYVALAIFAATYVALVMRNVRGLKVPIWLILLIGADAMVLSGSISVADAYAAINLQVIAFLFGMFVMVTALDISGGLETFATRLLGRARAPRDVLYLSFFGFALLSTVLMNDTIALMGTPIVITIAERIGMRVKPLLLSLAFAITIGSAVTPMGNPQNLLVAVSSGLKEPVLQFAYYLLIPIVIDLILTALLLRYLFRRDLDPVELKRPEVTGRVEPLRDGGLARKAAGVVGATMVAIIGVNVLGAVGFESPFGISEVAFLGAVLLLAISGKSREILAAFDWGVLVLFAGLFVLMQAVSDNGIIGVLATHLPALSTADPSSSAASIITSSVVLSQVLSNVPMVGLYIPLMKSIGFSSATPYAWAALAGGSTLAGNLTLLGAASNLIIAEGAERRGHRLGFYEFLKVGVLVTLLDVFVLYAYFFLVLAVF